MTKTCSPEVDLVLLWYGEDLSERGRREEGHLDPFPIQFSDLR